MFGSQPGGLRARSIWRGHALRHAARTAVGVVLLSLLASSALAKPVVTCRPFEPAAPPAPPNFVLSLHETGVTCKIARDVETYSLRHETLPFFVWKIDGHRWHGTLFSRAHGHTYFRYTSPAGIVWVTIRLPVQ